jgi:hypothetical protein
MSYMCCIMRQCFVVGTSYGFWLGLTIPAQGWDVTNPSKVKRHVDPTPRNDAFTVLHDFGPRPKKCF